jgi:putative SOS response-associated peptidase YedK
VDGKENTAMCGRYTLKTKPKDLAEYFKLYLDDVPPLEPRYNIAPSQDVPIIRDDELSMMKWGLVPS